MKDLISVIIPSRATEKNETLTSLKKQTYKDYELIEIIDKNCKGASWARNQGLKKARGSFIFFCDNDIDLEPDCLENLHNILKENKNCDWAFGRFKIDNIEFNLNKGNKKIPKNKYSQEFIDYFHGISTMSLIRKKCRPKMDNNLKRYNDWDLWIRLTRKGHLPVFCDKMLFSTVNRPTGISKGNDSREHLDILMKKHLKKIGDIVIPHHSQHDMLADVLKRIDNRIWNIIIVSGGSFAENCNKGARLAETKDIIFLNDDTEPSDELLAKMIEDKNPITGIAQYIPTTHATKYGISFDKSNFNRFLAGSIGECDMPSGFCFKVRKSVWEKLGGLDEIFKSGAEDIDFFLRAKSKGYKFGYVEEAIKHFLSKSEGRFNHANANNRILEKRWKKKVCKEKPRGGDEGIRAGEGRTAKSDFYFRGKKIMKGDYINENKETMEKLKKADLIN